MQMWHGGTLPMFPDKVIPKGVKGRYEHGPGIYFTSSYGTAYKYGRGSRYVTKVTIDNNLTFLEDSKLELSEVLAFVEGQHGMIRKAHVLADLHRYDGQAEISACILVNLCVNHETLSGKYAPALAKFLVDKGIHASKAKWSLVPDAERWLVLFDPCKILRVRRVKLSEVGADEWNLID